MIKVTTYMNSIVCVEDTVRQTNLTRDLSHAQLMQLLDLVQSRPQWQERARSGPQYGMVVFLPALPWTVTLPQNVFDQ